MEVKRSRIWREALCPPIGALLRYRTRIVRVIAEARGQHAMIESLETTDKTFVSTVRWNSLRELGAQLFQFGPALGTSACEPLARRTGLNFEPGPRPVPQTLTRVMRQVSVEAD
jgi:hypothetical protein